MIILLFLALGYILSIEWKISIIVIIFEIYDTRVVKTHVKSIAF